jgi:hypothetical protein
MKRVGEVHSPFEPSDGTRNSGRILDIHIHGSQDRFHRGDDRRPGLPIGAPQDPLEFDHHGLGHKDRIGRYCPPRRCSLSCIVQDEKTGEDVSIDRAHVAA